MKPGLIFKEYIEKDFGYTTTSKLADDISWLAVSSIEEGYFKQDLQKNSKKKWQSALCKIFKKDYTPGLKITLLIINVLGNTKPDPVIAKRLIAQKIIEIYHNRYEYDEISTILMSFPENNINLYNSEKISIINERWFNKYYNLLIKYGGIDWEDIEINYSKLEENVTDICKLINDCIVNKQYKYFKETFQYAENFLQICGYRSCRLHLSAELNLAAREKSDLETSIQARASHTWSLVTDREILKATTILNSLISDFELLNKYSEKTNFAKIISYENLARIAIIQGKFSKAESWFSQQHDEIEYGKRMFNLISKTAIRYELPIDYHRGRIYFYQEDYQSALFSFKDTQESAKKIGWTRMEICAQNWLGGIYTEIGDFKSAEKLLLDGLDKAKEIKSKGRLGFYYRSLAILYEKSGRYSEANPQITKAHDVFDELGMKNAANEVLDLIHTNIAS